jgi:hypothetical protein
VFVRPPVQHLYGETFCELAVSWESKTLLPQRQADHNDKVSFTKAHSVKVSGKNNPLMPLGVIICKSSLSQNLHFLHHVFVCSMYSHNKKKSCPDRVHGVFCEVRTES